MCDLCHKTWKKKCALGGHKAKAHPGESLKYANKIKKWNERETHRRFLLKAKKVYARMYPNKKRNNAKLTEIKIKLMFKYEADGSDADYSEDEKM